MRRRQFRAAGPCTPPPPAGSTPPPISGRPGAPPRSPPVGRADQGARRGHSFRELPTRRRASERETPGRAPTPTIHSPAAPKTVFSASRASSRPWRHPAALLPIPALTAACKRGSWSGTPIGRNENARGAEDRGTKEPAVPHSNGGQRSAGAVTAMLLTGYDACIKVCSCDVSTLRVCMIMDAGPTMI